MPWAACEDKGSTLQVQQPTGRIAIAFVRVGFRFSLASQSY